MGKEVLCQVLLGVLLWALLIVAITATIIGMERLGESREIESLKNKKEALELKKQIKKLESEVGK